MNNQKYGDSARKLAQIFHSVYNWELTTKAGYLIMPPAIVEHKCTYNNVPANHLETKYLIAVVRQHGDINYSVPATPFLIAKDAECIGNTALHFAIIRKDLEFLASTLKNDVNIMLKNRNNMTALHLIVEDTFNRSDYHRIDCSLAVKPFTDMILAKQMSLRITENPCDSNGLTHFHIACITNNTDAVEYFLRHGVEVDEAIDSNSTIYPSYTPLHIAARLSYVETVVVLIQYGADICAKANNGMTPLHVLLQGSLHIIHSQYTWRLEKPIENVKRNERIIYLLLVSNDLDTVLRTGLTPLQICCTTKDHDMIAHYLEAKADVHFPIDVKSPYKPGFTSLHLAALYNYETFQFLLQYERSDMGVQNMEHVTPFEICLTERTMTSDEIRSLVSHHPVWREATLTDNKTKIIDLLSSMDCPRNFISFLCTSHCNVNAQIPAHLSLWPGCTPLHLALTFSKRIPFRNDYQWSIQICSMVKKCLELGADMTIQNAYGSTALHWAFQFDRMNEVVNLLLKDRSKHFANPIDENGLSHLHIACTKAYVSMVTSLLSNGAIVNLTINTNLKWYKAVESARKFTFLPIGTTPLHIAVAKGSWEIVDMLVKHGANIYAKDTYGMTPMHWIIFSEAPRKVKNLLSLAQPLTECVTPQGFSLLHVAVQMSLTNDIERLIESGANIETTIVYKPRQIFNNNDPLFFLVEYANYTPLNMTLSIKGQESGLYLAERGADFVKLIKTKYLRRRRKKYLLVNYAIDETRRLLDSDDWTNYIFSIMKKSALVRESVAEGAGLTMLHVACWDSNINEIRHLLSMGADVNAQTDFDTAKWAGFTPLHFLLKKNVQACIMTNDSNNLFRQIDVMIQLLLDAGADVTLQNAKKDTPIHLAHKKYYNYPDFMRGAALLTLYHRRVNKLLNHIQDFSVNLVNWIGISTFHIACHMNNINIVNKYLEHHIDINQQVDFFCLSYPGSTPLHMALHDKSHEVEIQLSIVNTLLRNKIKINTTNFFGDTHLHTAVKSGIHRMDLFQNIIDHGAQVDMYNIKGLTPFEILLRSSSCKLEDIVFFLKNGYNANMYNPISKEGYLPLILLRANIDYSIENEEGNRISKDIIKVIMESTKHTDFQLDRNAIHNIVSQKMGNLACSEYTNHIENLKTVGHLINGQDFYGRTPLHVAVVFNNIHAVDNLLLSGADFNVVDNKGLTAFDYALKNYECKSYRSNSETGQSVMKSLLYHYSMLDRFHLHVNQRNKRAYEEGVRKESYDVRQITSRNFCAYVEQTKHIKVGEDTQSPVLYDFLSETGCVAGYTNMPKRRRTVIDEYFHKTRYELHYTLREVAGVLRLQYGKALARKKIALKAGECLSHVAHMRLPDLCTRIIMRHLSNMQLSAVIEAVCARSR